MTQSGHIGQQLLKRKNILRDMVSASAAAHVMPSGSAFISPIKSLEIQDKIEYPSFANKFYSHSYVECV